MPTCDIAIIIVCAGRHGTTERRAGAPGMNTKYERENIFDTIGQNPLLGASDFTGRNNVGVPAWSDGGSPVV